MKKTLLILPVLLISLCALAATDPQSEKQAEEFYREGKYNEAAEISVSYTHLTLPTICSV